MTKQVCLTALGSEQRLSGETEFYLVFNDGDLRIPVPEKTAREVIKYMYVGAEDTAETPPEEVESQETHTASGTDEDGVDQI